MADKLWIPGATEHTGTVLHTEEDGTMHVEEVQDVEPILDYCDAARNTRFSAGDALDGMTQHWGEVPSTVYIHESRRMGYVPFANAAEMDMVLASILTNPDYSRFVAAPKQRDPGIKIKGRR